MESNKVYFLYFKLRGSYQGSSLKYAIIAKYGLFRNNSKLHIQDFPRGSEGKASAYNAGHLDSMPGSGRSPGEGNGNQLQYSCLENPMDRVAWQATVHGIAKSQTRLSDFTFTFTFITKHMILSQSLKLSSLIHTHGNDQERIFFTGLEQASAQAIYFKHAGRYEAKRFD